MCERVRLALCVCGWQYLSVLVLEEWRQGVESARGGQLERDTWKGQAAMLEINVTPFKV